jgi:hypothetical protein
MYFYHVSLSDQWICSFFCCSGIVLLLLANVIGLSLIAVYLSPHGSILNLTQEGKQLQYTEDNKLKLFI